MNKKPNEPASNFLSPSGWVRAAQKAHPAFKFAIVVGGLAAVVVTFTRFGASPATLVFGVVIVVVLMVLFLVFAQAARLRRHKLSLASLFLVWAFLCLSVGTALLLFTSTFFNRPLPFHDYIVRSMGLTPQPAPGVVAAADSLPECPKGYFYLQSRATDLFLGHDQAGRLVQAADDEVEKQIWTTVGGSEAGYCYVTTKTLADAGRDECLEIKRGHPDDYPGIGHKRTINADDQQWAFDQVQPGYYVIISKLTGRAIDVPWGDPKKNLLGFFGPHKNNNQQWKLIPF